MAKTLIKYEPAIQQTEKVCKKYDITAHQLYIDHFSDCRLGKKRIKRGQTDFSEVSELSAKLVKLTETS